MPFFRCCAARAQCARVQRRAMPICARECLRRRAARARAHAIIFALFFALFIFFRLHCHCCRFSFFFFIAFSLPPLLSTSIDDFSPRRLSSFLSFTTPDFLPIFAGFSSLVDFTRCRCCARLSLVGYLPPPPLSPGSSPLFAAFHAIFLADFTARCRRVSRHYAASPPRRFHAYRFFRQQQRMCRVPPASSCAMLMPCKHAPLPMSPRGARQRRAL